tara:strand:- start:10 stop:204 length:195 start_codon:yes stop_codon:yes gene_type:complete
MKKLKQVLKDIMTGIMRTYLIIMWLFLVPFVYLFDRLFGGWKDYLFGGWKDEEKEKTIRQSKRD